jgi:methenyltetrahydrofolate cyclohydrolase
MPENVYDMVFSDYIDLAASKSHTPGGGNVSAAVGVLASSMVCMVANLTLSNKKYADHHKEAQNSVDRLMGLIERLKDLTYRDMQAFNDYMAAFRMPKETKDDKNKRDDALEKAAKSATLTPLEICKCCLDVVKEAYDLSRYGNLMAISDVGVGALIGEAALRACMLSVDINLPNIKDTEFVEDVRNERASLFTLSEEYKILTIANVKEKMG